MGSNFGPVRALSDVRLQHYESGSDYFIRPYWANNG